MKKITALILAIILCFTLAIPALGSEMSVNGQAYSINGIDVYKYPLKASQYFSVETNLAFYRLFSSGIMNMQMTIIPENTTIEDLRANCTEFSYWVIDEKNGDIILEITSDTGNLIQVIIENAS